MVYRKRVTVLLTTRAHGFQIRVRGRQTGYKGFGVLVVDFAVAKLGSCYFIGRSPHLSSHIKLSAPPTGELPVTWQDRERRNLGATI